jgi:hypothetical protein
MPLSGALIYHLRLLFVAISLVCASLLVQEIQMERIEYSKEFDSFQQCVTHLWCLFDHLNGTGGHLEQCILADTILDLHEHRVQIVAAPLCV